MFRPICRLNLVIARTTFAITTIEIQGNDVPLVVSGAYGGGYTN